MLRWIFHEIKRYESERRISNKSTYWLIFELIWRDFFRYLCAKYKNKVFYPGGITGKKISWNNDEDAIFRWKHGLTGMPLVDANMRELLNSGLN
jgi:deoxyribodipyrimidine photo-lyase